MCEYMFIDNASRLITEIF